MKVTIPGFVVPIAGARLEINGRIVFLRPRDKAPVFEVGAKELRGIEHLMGPLTVDYPNTKTKKVVPKPGVKAPPAELDPATFSLGEGIVQGTDLAEPAAASGIETVDVPEETAE